MVCPPRYCCTTDQTACPWNANEACTGNRDPRVPLCGACMSDHSHAVDGIDCVPNDKCGDAGTVAVYAVLLLLFWSALCVFFLHQARFEPVLRCVPALLRPGAANNGAASVLVYYFQMAAIAVPQGSQKVAERAGNLLCVLGRLVNMDGQLPSWAGCTSDGSSGGVCVAVGTSSVAAIGWNLMVPALLTVLLWTVAVMLRRVYHCVERAPGVGANSTGGEW